MPGFALPTNILAGAGSSAGRGPQAGALSPIRNADSQATYIACSAAAAILLAEANISITRQLFSNRTVLSALLIFCLSIHTSCLFISIVSLSV